jgi:hypothetical protein
LAIDQTLRSTRAKSFSFPPEPPPIRLSPEVSANLRAKGWQFYDFIAASLFMCPYRVAQEHIEALSNDLASAIRAVDK